MKKANVISKIAVKNEFRKIYRTKDTSFKKYESKEENSNDFSKLSQASACDIIITKLMLNNKANVNSMYRACTQYVQENDVVMKNYNTDKTKILARLKRHLSSDNVTRLSKRAVTLT